MFSPMSRPYATARRFPRVRCEVPLFVEQLGDGDFQCFSRTRVVGEGGCMFVSTQRVGFLSLLKLSISVAGRIVHADGRVVYERNRRQLGRGETVEVGIEFLRLSPADRSLLRALSVPPS